MDRGAWWATVHRVRQSQTWLKWLNMRILYSLPVCSPTNSFYPFFPKFVVNLVAILTGTPGVGDGQGGLACCIHGVAKSRTWLSDWTELNWTEQVQDNRMAHCDFDLHCLMILDVKHIFTCLVFVIFGEMSIQFLCSFLNCLLLNCKCSLCILGVIP